MDDLKNALLTIDQLEKRFAALEERLGNQADLVKDIPDRLAALEKELRNLAATARRFLLS